MLKYLPMWCTHWLPRPKCSRGAVYTAYTLLRLCSVYYRYTATRRKYICSVIVYCLCSIYKFRSPGSVLTGYPSHGSVRYTACTVYTAATLYCWQWTCSIYCTPLHLYCTSVWVSPLITDTEPLISDATLHTFDLEL